MRVSCILGDERGQSVPAAGCHAHRPQLVEARSTLADDSGRGAAVLGRPEAGPLDDRVRRGGEGLDVCGVAPRVHVHHRALTALDRRSIGSRLDATALCHVLVGLLPEFLDEGWEMHEKIVDVCLRNQKRARGRARSVFLCRRWYARRIWWRRRTAR